MRTATFEVLPQQAEQIETEALFSAAYGGVGSGKTFGAQWKMFKRLRMYPKAGHYVVGADFEQLRGGYFLDFRAMLEEILNWQEGRDYQYRDSPRPTIILLDTGARIRALSAELAERIRSTQIQSLHGEEPQTWKNGNGEQVWKTLVGRMRHNIRSAKAHRDMPIQAWLTFNPGGEPGVPIGSWLYNLIERQWKAVGYPSWRFSLRDNYLLENAEQYIKNIEDNLPEEEWATEIDGHWKTTGSGVYYTFSRSLHCQPIDELPPIAWDLKNNPRIWWSLDFNIEWMASVCGQVHVQPMVTKGLKPVDQFSTVIQRIPGPKVDGWSKRIHYVLKEFFLHDSGTEDAVEAFVNFYKALTGPLYGQVTVWLYGDPAGGARAQALSSRSAARTNWAIVGLALKNAGIPFVWRVKKNHPSVADRVNAANLQFRSGRLLGGTRGVLIDEQNCANFCVDLEAVRRSKREGEIIDKSDDSPEGRKRTHLTDAYGYFSYVDRAESNGEKHEFPDWLAR